MYFIFGLFGRLRYCLWAPETYIRFTALWTLSGITQVRWCQKVKTNLDFTEARDSKWVAVASAGSYANLHLAPDR